MCPHGSSWTISPLPQPNHGITCRFPCASWQVFAAEPKGKFPLAGDFREVRDAVAVPVMLTGLSSAGSAESSEVLEMTARLRPVWLRRGTGWMWELSAS